MHVWSSGAANRARPVYFQQIKPNRKWNKRICCRRAGGVWRNRCRPELLGKSGEFVPLSPWPPSLKMAAVPE
ncbi:hypothetical protein NDU88_005114 [Pleurodeles waltl]|uniref:Uncharacterized protein n=1 Tax=Pleurodeles waltl TaxID=8319 RepID=A0AAV7VKP7_PLEWA|nr:hypothetical protein NDU88_005114 [Pleurodeles waltl]